MTENPLGEYFRKPSIYIELPSKGKFYKQPPNLSADGELAVFGMTARDELVLKNPDALLNGEGIIEVFKSVVPDIKNPGEIPTPDYNSILLAMRVASYGKNMDYMVTCPECSNVDTVTFDLHAILASHTILEDEYIAELESGIKVSIKPTTLHMQNRIALRTLEQSRLLEVLNEDSDTEVKLKKFSQAFKTLANITFDIVLDGIVHVQLPDGEIVENHAHITEWLNNITKSQYNIVNEVIEKINNTGVNNEFHHVCSACSADIDQNMMFDPSSFFG
jgi:hypothetical protein